MSQSASADHAYEKVKKAVNSCRTLDQLAAAHKWGLNVFARYDMPDYCWDTLLRLVDEKYKTLTLT